MAHCRVPSLFGAALLWLSACGGNTSTSTGAIRAVNGIADSSDLDVVVSNVDTVNGLSFDAASAIIDVPAKIYNAQFTDGNSIVPVDNVNVDQGDVTTIFTYGTKADGTEAGFPAEESLTRPLPLEILLQPVHAAYQVSISSPNLNFYLSPPEAACTLGSVVPFLSDEFIGTAKFALATPAQTGSISAFGATLNMIMVTDQNGVTLFCSGSKGVPLGRSDSYAYQIAVVDATTAQQAQYGSSVVVLLLGYPGGQEILLNGQN